VIDTEDYAQLFLSSAPLIDTRAPIEFARGSFPTAENLPLMTDHEREQVGTCYKQKGQDAAIALGHQLVCGAVQKQRIEAWLRFAQQNPDGYLFCFRGGLRSQICQQWMREAGCQYPRVLGGYKAMRRYLIDTLEKHSVQQRFVLLGGHTGSAKTVLLNQLTNSIDLECLAHHRGSAFGRRATGQPPQIGFENGIAIALLKQTYALSPDSPIVLEDESKLIGQRYIPDVLFGQMCKSPLVLIESSLDERVEHTYKNYILDALKERQNAHGIEQGFIAFSDYLHQSLYRIRKRLGGTRHAELQALLEKALDAHRSGKPDVHRAWIERLLGDYYDPMYNYQIAQKKERVLFRGDRQAVQAFLQQIKLTDACLLSKQPAQEKPRKS